LRDGYAGPPLLRAEEGYEAMTRLSVEDIEAD
jgi:hypothetical protein